MHAEDQDPGAAIGAAQSRDRFQPAEPGQVEIENDERRMVRSEQAERFFAVRRFANVAPRLACQQPPQPGADDRMIVDDQDLHVSASPAGDGIG